MLAIYIFDIHPLPRSFASKHVEYRINFKRWTIVAMQRPWQRGPRLLLHEVCATGTSTGCGSPGNFSGSFRGIVHDWSGIWAPGFSSLWDLSLQTSRLWQGKVNCITPPPIAGVAAPSMARHSSQQLQPLPVDTRSIEKNLQTLKEMQENKIRYSTLLENPITSLRKNSRNWSRAQQQCLHWILFSKPKKLSTTYLMSWKDGVAVFGAKPFRPPHKTFQLIYQQYFGTWT